MSQIAVDAALALPPPQAEERVPSARGARAHGAVLGLEGLPAPGIGEGEGFEVFFVFFGCRRPVFGAGHFVGLVVDAGGLARGVGVGGAGFWAEEGFRSFAERHCGRWWVGVLVDFGEDWLNRRDRGAGWLLASASEDKRSREFIGDPRGEVKSNVSRIAGVLG